jgi:beta-mannosidase
MLPAGEKPGETSASGNGDGGKTVLVDVWGVSALLTPIHARWAIDIFSITTGKALFHSDGEITLAANQSTPIISDMDISMLKPEDAVVSATIILSNGKVIRSSADWPQPLKYISFLDRGVVYSVDGEHVKLSADKPTKAVVLDVEDDDDSGLEWSDNGFDIMPGERVNVYGKGLAGSKVAVRWYGEGSILAH